MTLGVLAWRSAAFETLVLKLAAEVATFAASNAVCLRLNEEEEGLRSFSTLLLSQIGFELCLLLPVMLSCSARAA